MYHSRGGSSRIRCGGKVLECHRGLFSSFWLSPQPLSLQLKVRRHKHVHSCFHYFSHSIKFNSIQVYGTNSQQSHLKALYTEGTLGLKKLNIIHFTQFIIQFICIASIYKKSHLKVLHTKSKQVQCISIKYSQFLQMQSITIQIHKKPIH